MMSGDGKLLSEIAGQRLVSLQDGLGALPSHTCPGLREDKIRSLKDYVYLLPAV